MSLELMRSTNIYMDLFLVLATNYRERIFENEKPMRTSSSTSHIMYFLHGEI